MRALQRLALILFAALAPVAAAVAPAPAGAQEETVPNYDAWLRAVDRAESTIEAQRASSEAFEALRDEMQDWRRQFSQAQTINAARIRTVEAQLDAIGPPPAEGETEPASVAEIREALNARMEELRAPQRAAEVAFNRADALVAEVDQLLRQRQTQALLEVNGSPLLPSTWVNAIDEFTEADDTLLNEARRSLAGPAQLATFRDRLPLTLVLLAVGIAMLMLGRRWIERVTARFQDRQGTAGYTFLAFVISIGQILIPILGLFLAYLGLVLLGFGGTLTGSLLQALFEFGLALISARWVATSLFPRTDIFTGPLPFDASDRRSGRTYATLLGLVVGLFSILEAFGGSAGFTADTMGFFQFPLILVGALLFFRLGQLLRVNAAKIVAAAADEAGVEPGFLTRVLALLWRSLFVLAAAAPFFAAVGYANMARQLVISPILSLGLISFISVVHLVFKDIYALIARKTWDEAKEALAPVLLTLALTTASIPLFAVIWGVRSADIASAWAMLASGVAFGETRVGLSDLLTIVFVFALGFGLTRLFQATLRTAVLPRTRIDAGGRNAITAGVGYLGITLAAVAAITVAGVDLSGFALIASALSVGIGFGLQTIVSNFVSGLILLAERPIGEGDWIEVNGQMGIVKDISVRATVIQTFDRTDLIIPNSDLVSGTVTNWTRGDSIGRVIVEVGVGYGADSRQVEAILLEVCENHPLVVIRPPPAVFFRGFGDSALLFDARCIIRDINFKLAVESELYHHILQRFREAGIEIPFPQRDIWVRSAGTEPPAPIAAESEVRVPGEPPDRALTEDDDPATSQGQGESNDD